MKASQISVGSTYEDKNMTLVRTVTGIYKIEDGKRRVVWYSERSAVTGKLSNWTARESQMPLQEFATWATRPAGTKLFLSRGKFQNWLAGPSDKKGIK
jgi:hypothetical protein